MTMTATEKNLLGQILARVDATDRALRGSNGETGLISDFRTHIEISKDTNEKINVIENTLWGDREKGIDTEGLVYRVSEHDKFVKNVQKIYYSVLIACILMVFNLIVQVAYHINNTASP